MEKYLDELDLILSNLFTRYSMEKLSPGVLLSGGIDSSTIALLVSRYFPDYHLISMGTAATKDRPFAMLMATYLHRRLQWVDLPEGDIRENIATVVKLLKEADVPTTPMQVSLAMGYFLIFRAASREGITRIFTGQGPDITLGGYHKYKSITDVAAEIQKDLPLLEVDKRRDGAMAAYHHISLTNPYLEPEMVEFALRIPSEYKIKDGIEKYILRRYAEKKGVPAEIVARPKKAFQYSTGLEKVVKKHYLTA